MLSPYVQSRLEALAVEALVSEPLGREKRMSRECEKKEFVWEFNKTRF